MIPQIPDLLNLPGMAGGLGPGSVWFIGLLILFFGGVIIFLRFNPFAKFPVYVQINRRRKDGKRVVAFTNAKRIGKVGDEQEYELKNKQKISAQDFKHIDILANGKEFLELDELEDGRFEPHKHNVDEKTVKMDYDDSNYIVWKMRKNFEKFREQGFWDKWGIHIMTISAIFAIGFLLYITVQYGLMPLIDQGAGIASANRDFIIRQQNITRDWMDFMEVWMNRMDRPVAT